MKAYIACHRGLSVPESRLSEARTKIVTDIEAYLDNEDIFITTSRNGDALNIAFDCYPSYLDRIKSIVENHMSPGLAATIFYDGIEDFRGDPLVMSHYHTVQAHEYDSLATDE